MTTFAEKAVISSVPDTKEASQADAYEYTQTKEKEWDFESHIHLILKALDFERPQLKLAES